MAGKLNRKLKLTATIVKERLSFQKIPVANDKGAIVDFDENTDEKRYVVFDIDRDAPVGFGVAVNRTNMSYILQRRVGSRVIKATIGNTRNLALVDARARAKEALAKIVETGRSPTENKVLEEDSLRVADMTVAECIALYRTYLTEKSRPAKDSSLRGLEQALNRIKRPEINLADTKVGDLAGEKRIKEAFETLKAGRRKLRDGTKRAKHDSQAYDTPTITTAELTFRWVTRAVDYCCIKENRVAANQKRAPSLHHNPFVVIREEGMYRSRQELEEHYALTNARNPLQIRDGSLGRFLDALWDRRKIANYRTACDYLFLTLLWGTRRGEAAPLRWKPADEAKAKTCSWVDLKDGMVQFFDTKNRFNHTLPLAPAARRILQLRFDERDKGVEWVFPARNKRAVQGHYLDSKAILQGLRKTGGIEQLRTHDLRRTFATVAEEMCSYLMVKRLLNHRSLRDVTESYPQLAYDRILEELTRIEHAMLSTAPMVALGLLPVETSTKPVKAPQRRQ